MQLYDTLQKKNSLSYFADDPTMYNIMCMHPVHLILQCRLGHTFTTVTLLQSAPASVPACRRASMRAAFLLIFFILFFANMWYTFQDMHVACMYVQGII